MRGGGFVASLFLSGICIVLIVPILIYEFPWLVGADRAYTVTSGSMRPTIRPGDIIVVKAVQPSELAVGDVVTVESPLTYTHRIVEKRAVEGGYLFTLKGDANEDADPGLVEASDVVGRVAFVFPFGHLYTFYGFLLGLAVPGGLVIGKEAYRVYSMTRRQSKRQQIAWRRNHHRIVDTVTLLLVLIVVINFSRIFSPLVLGGSSSFFSDQEDTQGCLGAGVWEVDASVEIDPDTLNIDSQGQWVVAYVETEYDESDIDLGTVMLDGSIAASSAHIQEGCLAVKFDRSAIIKHLLDEGFGEGDTVEVEVSGKFTDGVRFVGRDTIRLVSSEGCEKKP